MANRIPIVVVAGQVQQLQPADTTLNVGSYAPGSFTLQAGQFVIMTNQLILTTNQRVTLAGNSRIKIS